MKRLVPYIAIVALAAAAAGCNKGPGSTAYNNSGSSAAPGSTTTTTTTTPATTTASSDTSSPASSGSMSATPSSSDSSSSGSANVVGDTVTTGKVKAAIATEPALKDADIVVKTDGGVVVLSGTAKSQDQVSTATNLAQRQEGVNRVETQIVVR